MHLNVTAMGLCSIRSWILTVGAALLPVRCASLASTRTLGRRVVVSTSSEASLRPSTQPLSSNQKALSEGPRFPATWVPLGSIRELNPDRPTPVQFLNQNYVVFKGDKEQWVVMDDACPHRLAPLSEGRIDDSSGERRVACSYHGWAFDTSGICQDIPQATESIKASAKANSKCHVMSYSTVVFKDIVWAWLWKEDAVEEALKDPWITPEYMLQDVQTVVSTYTRDMPYGWDTLMENLVDPAHIPFAHHNLQGTRDDAIPINLTISQPVTKSGFQFQFSDRTMKRIRRATGRFRAPFILTFDGEYETMTPEKPQFFNLTTIGIPTKPGWNRFIVIIAFPSTSTTHDQEQHGKDQHERETNTKKRGDGTALRFKILQLFPVWILHILNSRFLDSDLALLHYQEQEREKRGGDKMRGGIYFMPSPSDRSINAFRKWKETYASVLLPLPPPIQSRAVLFDRYTQHTYNCRHCSDALAQVQKLRKVTVGGSALGGILIATKFVSVGGGLSVVAVCLGIILLLNIIEKALSTSDVRHYENN